MGAKNIVSGFGDELKNMVVGISDLAQHPIETVRYIVTHSKEVGQAFVAPYVEDWQNGRRWRAIGRGTAFALPFFLGGLLVLLAKSVRREKQQVLLEKLVRQERWWV
ncbi:MAG: hypothetical protein GXO35_06680 [Gammaproteobacteria bacterium]|nr:hypothetical protein [Gammaproteobacteria bacterium]